MEWNKTVADGKLKLDGVEISLTIYKFILSPKVDDMKDKNHSSSLISSAIASKRF